MPGILADAKWSDSFRVLLRQLNQELEQLSARIAEMDKVIERTVADHEACQRLTTIPGIGSVTATALVAAIGNGATFRRGRDLSAWVGMVPREYTTGGRQKLLGISKRGNSYLRRLFVQGARAVMQRRNRQTNSLGRWLDQLTARAHQNVAIVALANKLLRVAWAVLHNNEPYRSRELFVSDTGASPLSLSFHVPERSSPSRVRCAAQKPRALDCCGPF